MAKPSLLGIEYAAQAMRVFEEWERLAEKGNKDERRIASAQLRGLNLLRTRIGSNPLGAGNPMARDRWPRALVRDYGHEIPNLFRFELADRWRGYYTLIGEPGGVRAWVLYLWDHETYNKQSGYRKK